MERRALGGMRKRFEKDDFFSGGNGLFGMSLAR